jgi:hypothetical protein
MISESGRAWDGWVISVVVVAGRGVPGNEAWTWEGRVILD